MHSGARCAALLRDAPKSPLMWGCVEGPSVLAEHWAARLPKASPAQLRRCSLRGRGFSYDRPHPRCCTRMQPSHLSYAFAIFFSVLALTAVLLPEPWLPSSERYVLGAAFLVVAAILLPRA
jgi:hypothetical protein